MDVTYTEVDRKDAGDGTFVVSLHGEFDLFTAPELSRDFAEVLDRGPRVVVVDLANATFVDSTTLGVLIEARHELVGRGGRMVLTSSSDVLRRVLEQTGIDSLFDLTQDGAAPRRAERKARARAA